MGDDRYPRSIADHVATSRRPDARYTRRLERPAIRTHDARRHLQLIGTNGAGGRDGASESHVRRRSARAPCLGLADQAAHFGWGERKATYFHPQVGERVRDGVGDTPASASAASLAGALDA